MAILESKKEIFRGILREVMAYEDFFHVRGLAIPGDVRESLDKRKSGAWEGLREIDAVRWVDFGGSTSGGIPPSI